MFGDRQEGQVARGRGGRPPPDQTLLQEQEIGGIPDDSARWFQPSGRETLPRLCSPDIEGAKVETPILSTSHHALAPADPFIRTVISGREWLAGRPHVWQKEQGNVRAS